MKHHGTVTSVWNGIESTSVVEDDDLVIFYAKMLGVVQGAAGAGSSVTNVVTTTDYSA